MARVQRAAADAVDRFGVTDGTTVLAVGPDHGFIEALSDAAGSGKVVVQAPPPDEDTPDGVEVVDDLPTGPSDVVVGWIGVVAVHELRGLAERVASGGRLWVVLPKVARDERAPVTEGDVKRALLSTGFKPGGRAALAADTFALEYRPRR